MEFKVSDVAVEALKDLIQEKGENHGVKVAVMGAG